MCGGYETRQIWPGISISGGYIPGKIGGIDVNRAKKLLGLFTEDQGQLFNSKESAIEQAKANAKTFNVPYYVNDTTAGLRVEREPIKTVGTGTHILFVVSPEGEELE